MGKPKRSGGLGRSPERSESIPPPPPSLRGRANLSAPRSGAGAQRRGEGCEPPGTGVRRSEPRERRWGARSASAQHLPQAANPSSSAKFARTRKLKRPAQRGGSAATRRGNRTRDSQIHKRCPDRWCELVSARLVTSAFGDWVCQTVFGRYAKPDRVERVTVRT